MRFLILLAAVATAGCLAGNITAGIPQENHFNYTLLFCGDCIPKLLQLINSSNEIKCALYNADESVMKLLQQKNATVIVDRNAKTYGTTAIKRNSSGLMHNKFCVFNSAIVWTGSYNPVKRISKDDVMIINSTLLAANYLNELDELGSDRSSTTTTKILLNKTLIENYFCPEDGCIDRLRQQLEKAESSIYFATYSFTSAAIANELIIKSSKGIEVKGIMENGGSYSQLETLQQNNISATVYKGAGILHHKFFIIDGAVVVTGSFNPTKNADTRNDENVLVVHDEGVAEKYLENFELLRKQK